MNNFRSGWYLIYTKPRHEKKVHERLSQLDIRSFLPITRKLRSWHDRKKYVYEPLFPSYVFVYLKDMQHYYYGMDTEGALYYVRTGKDIAKVNESIVDSIRLLTESGTGIEVSAGNIAPGQQLTIHQGPLTGVSGEVVQVRGSQKIVVRVHLLQRNLLAILPSDYLMPVHS
ncbi:MAG TPA: UpxY family transcription antiterminator [Puia sp.]|jgi:transcription antitermination factor NusG|nr:UpxY family transcription antiterminator [Puia sp.]